MRKVQKQEIMEMLQTLQEAHDEMLLTKTIMRLHRIF